jgi:ABC-2 type transport system permease protein
MRAFWNLALTQIKIYLREPAAAFFTLAWAPLMLILFGSIYGNDPATFVGGYGYIDATTAAYIAMVIDNVGLLTIPVDVAMKRETGMLHRLRATPLRSSTFILADVLTYIIVLLLGTLIMCAVAVFGFGAQFYGNWGLLFLAFLLTTFAMYAMGYLLAAIAPSVQVANVFGFIVGFIMMFLSGATIPMEVLPPAVQNISRFIPLTYGVRLLKASWLQGSWEGQGLSVGVLLGVALICSALAARFWRWE